MGLGGIYGCDCKEVYRLPHITYPYSSCIRSLLQQHPYFEMFFVLYIHMYIIIYLIGNCMFILRVYVWYNN